MTVYLTIGFPGSGKSTWSKQFAKENENVIIINRDAFRTMIKDEYTFNFRYEPFIKESTNKAIEQALEHGLDIIVDETHIKLARRIEIVSTIRNFENSYGLINTDYGKTKIVYMWFTESNRNIDFRMKEARGYKKEKWVDVIEGMKKIFEKPTETEGYDQLVELNPLEERNE